MRVVTATLATVALFLASPARAEVKGTVALMTYLDGLALAEQGEFTQYLQSITTEALSKSGLTLLTPDKLDELVKGNMSDDDYSKACTGETCAVKVGQAINLTYVFSARVSKLADGKLGFGMQFFDVKTGTLIAATRPISSRTHEGIEQVFDDVSHAFFDQALDKIGAKTPWKLAAEEAERRAAAAAAAERVRQAEEAKARAEEAKARRAEAESRSEGGSRGSFLPERNPTGLDLDRRLAIRAGLGSLTGVLGVGVEYRFTDNLSAAIGYGSYFTLGASWSFIGDGNGGLYLDAHFASTNGTTGERSEKGFGATVGWDLRLVPWLSLKAGLGAAWTTLQATAPHLRPLVVDASAGMVF